MINKKINFIIIILLVLSSCIKKPTHIYKNHSLPVMEINAKNSDLWNQKEGIYVEGIGNSENWQGLKANYFSGKKININLRYFVDDSLVLNEKALMKVSGGGSRKQPQKSFNIYAKNLLNYSFFESKTINNFKSFRLRVSGQDWRSTLLRDALMHSLIEQTNIDSQAYQPTVVYLNNEYWGIYNIREKFSETYLRQNHPEKEGPLDILENELYVKSGDTIHYQIMIDYIKTHNLSEDFAYNQVTQWIDMPNLIDYYCAQIYCANTDWPSNNIKFWRAKKEGSKWRWFIHDTDLGFGFAPIWKHPGGVDHNTMAFVLNEKQTKHHNHPWSTFLIRNLFKNEDFKSEFLSKLSFHLENTFNTERVINQIDSLCKKIEVEMPRHISRWANEADYAIQNMEQWENNILKLKSFAEDRPNILLQYVQEQFSLSNQDWLLIKEKNKINDTDRDLSRLDEI